MITMCQYSLLKGGSGHVGCSLLGLHRFSWHQGFNVLAISRKNNFERKSNPTSQHPNILYIIDKQDEYYLLSNLLICNVLLIIIILLLWCWVLCWVVGKVLGLCWVLGRFVGFWSVNFGCWRNVNKRKCWESWGETLQKIAVLGMKPNKPNIPNKGCYILESALNIRF